MANHGTFPNAAVATDCGPASDVGVEMLKKGGHAVDAAIASMLCVGLFNCHSAGIGGGSFINIYDAETNQHVFINSKETAPKKAHKSMYAQSGNSIKGTLAIAVPGELMGYWEAHQRFGKLKWEQLFAPAIKCAEEGIPVSATLATAIQRSTDFCESDIKDPKFNLSPMLLRPDGTLKKEGDVIVHKELAKTLRRISENGADEFYHGSLVDDIVKDIQDGFGDSIICVDDFKEYKVDSGDALKVDIDDNLELYIPPPPSTAITAALTLKIIRELGLTPIDLENDEGITMHRIIEAFKLSNPYKRRLGDRNFADVKSLVESMCEDELAKELRYKITDDQTHCISYYDSDLMDFPECRGTSHMSILAEDGSAVSVTSTISLYFGCKVRGTRTGIIFNNTMNNFSNPKPDRNQFGLPPSPSNFIAPEKRPITTTSPCIIADKNVDDVKDKVKMVIGASGARQIVTVIPLTIIRHLWLGKSLKDSVGDWRLHHQLVPNIVQHEHNYDKEDVLNFLKSLGHKTMPFSPPGGIVQAISRLEHDAMISAVSDHRKGGSPNGY